MNRLLNPKVYTKQDPPMLNETTNVRIGIYIFIFHSISEQNMDYALSMYLRQEWRDPRLQFDPVADDLDSSTIKLEGQIWSQIWFPDIFFRNEKQASYHKITVNNRMLSLKSDGTLWYVTKITATLSCPMKLQKYPMDTQVCPIMFESFGYLKNTLEFSWLDNPVDVEKELKLTQYTYNGYQLRDCSQNASMDASPCIAVKFVLQRDLGFFMIQVFIPSILIVILSWVSFWINVEAVPARVSLGLLTVLTTTTQSTSINATLPKVSYIKAIDVWMSSCLGFVFSALCEYALVNVAARHKPPGAKKPIPDQVAGERRCCYKCCNPQFLCTCLKRKRTDVELGTMVAPMRPSRATEVHDGKYRARRIDKISRRIFPLTFIIFNVVYWIFYTFPSSGSTNTPDFPASM